MTPAKGCLICAMLAEAGKSVEARVAFAVLFGSSLTAIEGVEVFSAKMHATTCGEHRGALSDGAQGVAQLLAVYAEHDEAPAVAPAVRVRAPREPRRRR